MSRWSGVAACCGALLASAQPRTVQHDSCFTVALAASAPEGYRYPPERDVSDGNYWYFYRYEEYATDASCTSIDFDGDGVKDVATFVLALKGDGFALVVLLSGQGMPKRRVLLQDTGAVYRATDGVLRVVKAGDYATFMGCGGALKVPVDLHLSRPALDYFNRVPESRERVGERTRPEHRLFEFGPDGDPSQRDLCTPGEWARYQRLGY